MITVAIPLGPHPEHARWLDECLRSVYDQSVNVDEILIIDDMHGLTGSYEKDGCRIWRSPWLLGVAHAFNFGVALARNECVFMLGADDTLEPDCIQRVLAQYAGTSEEDKGSTYYFVSVRYLDDREDNTQFLPCNAAMVTKSLWRKTGGFPIEAASGACDAAFVSRFWNRADEVRFAGVGEGTTLYNYRPHADTDTAQRSQWQGIILATRGLVTEVYDPPRWGRYDL